MKNTKKVIAFLSSLSLLVSASAFQASAAQLTQKTFKLGDVDLDGDIDLGEFGFIYFIDFDRTRARSRTVDVVVIGD